MNNSSFSDPIRIYQRKRDELIEFTEEQRRIIDILEMERWYEELDQLDTNLRNDMFKVMIIGEFKTGKSTFINALLREEVLPAYAIPCTAIISEVKYGEKRVVLHYIKDENGKESAPPIDISIHDLEQYVVIQDTVNSSEDKDKNPYERAELFYPLELCRDGVMIVDSPGLNENPKRQAITLSYLPTVDAIIFVCDSNKIGPSISEQRTIDDMHTYGYEDIFFVCNRFDTIPNREQERLKIHARRTLGKLTQPYGDRRVFFISARQALDGKLTDSGLSFLEKELAHFLTEDKGKLRFKRVVRKLREASAESRMNIIHKQGMLQSKLTDLDQRIEKANEELRGLEADRHQIENLIREMCRDLSDGARNKVIRLIDDLTRDIEGWVKEYEVKTPLDLRDAIRMQKAVERVTNEVVAHIAQKAEEKMTEWRQRTFDPYMSQQLDKLRSRLDDRLQEFVRNLDDLQLKVAGVSTDVSPQIEQVGALERIFSTVGGFFLGGIGAAALGAAFGHREMLKSLLPQFGVAIALVLFGVVQPWVIIGALLGAGFVQGLVRMNAANEQIKKAIGQKMVDEWQTRKAEQANEIAQQVYASALTIHDIVSQGTLQEINAFRDNMRSIRQSKERGEERQEQLLLENATQRLADLNSKLNQFVDEHLVIAGE